MQTQPAVTHISNQNKRGNYVQYTKPNTSTSTPNQSGQNQNWPLTLPQGWKREESMRPLGLGKGKSDVYYISPHGQVVRTKQEMQNILGEKYDTALFDWRLGKFTTPSQKSKRSESLEPSDAPNSKSPRIDNIANFPIRRCPFPSNEFKQLIIRSHPDCKRTDAKSSTQEPPHQLFWEKRLVSGVAVDPETGEPFKPLTLPKGIQSAGVPGYNATQLVQSLIFALSAKSSPITGQEQQPSAIEKNPCVTVNHLQPMIKTFIVTDEDIHRQEARVRELRRKLETARKKLHPRYDTEREG